MLKIFKYSFSLLFFAIFFISCKSSTDPAPVEAKHLVQATLVNTLSKSEIKTKLTENLGAQGSALTIFVASGLKSYIITYNTVGPNGENVVASGAFMVPTDLNKALALGSYHHGTLSNETDAPSYFNFQTEAALGLFFASTGFFMAMPDYLGYGESKTFPHPYENRKGLAQPNVDFLLAVKEFIATEKLNWNNNLLLCGYSEGGYANLATQKMLEENYSKDFNIKVSVCGAGAYNKTATIKSFLTTDTSGEVVNNKSYIWVMLTYDRIYAINRPYAQYFVEPYLTQITNLKQNATVNVSFKNILTSNFKTGIINGTDMPWINAVKDNDIYDWKPITPTVFYHGTADTYVPFLNSQTAYDAMNAKGANVKLVKVDNGTHYSTANEFVLGAFNLFNNYKND